MLCSLLRSTFIIQNPSPATTVFSMAPSVLGIGLPATSDIVPWIMRGSLRKSLDVMEADMTASPYDWEMLYLTPDMPFDVCTTKLKEKKWDVVMVGSKCLFAAELKRYPYARIR